MELFQWAKSKGPALSCVETPLSFATMELMSIDDGGALDLNERMYWCFSKTFERERNHRMLPWETLAEIRPVNGFVAAERTFDFIYEPHAFLDTVRDRRWKQAREQGYIALQSLVDWRTAQRIMLSTFEHLDGRDDLICGVPPQMTLRLAEAWSKIVTDDQVKTFIVLFDGEVQGFTLCWIERELRRVYMPLGWVAQGHSNGTRAMLEAIARWALSEELMEIIDTDATGNKGLCEFKMHLKPSHLRGYFMTLDHAPGLNGLESFYEPFTDRCISMGVNGRCW